MAALHTHCLVNTHSLSTEGCVGDALQLQLSRGPDSAESETRLQASIQAAAVRLEQEKVRLAQVQQSRIMSH